MKIDINKKYRTQSGTPVRILCIDGPGSFRGIPQPVVAIMDETVASFTADGLFFGNETSSKDLIEVREPREFEISGEGRNWKCISGIGWTPGETIRVREIID